MNTQLTRVAWVAMALIVTLVVATTYWQTWARPGLAARQDNEIQRVAEFEVRRGLILAPTRVVARNVPRRARGGRTLYFRRYPQGKLAAHIVGYSTVARSRAGLEKSLNGVLTGITLPFVSYGGSSIVSNFVMLALLMLVSHRAVRRAPA